MLTGQQWYYCGNRWQSRKCNNNATWELYGAEGANAQATADDILSFLGAICVPQTCVNLLWCVSNATPRVTHHIIVTQCYNTPNTGGAALWWYMVWCVSDLMSSQLGGFTVITVPYIHMSYVCSCNTANVFRVWFQSYIKLWMSCCRKY